MDQIFQHLMPDTRQCHLEAEQHNGKDSSRLYPEALIILCIPLGQVFA